MAGTYKNYLKLLEQWPLDKNKPARDLGQYIRNKIKLAFATGRLDSSIEKDKCNRHYESLQRIVTNYYYRQYPRKLNSTATGFTSDQCNFVLSPEAQAYFEKESKSKFERVKERIKGKHDEESNQK
ncbi:ubiquinol-cytochrome-c reductase complex assembly factor 2 [Chelonus insularis]|uniref:ubiquinol-cytochrome-c reductase complex assembly factor 2 n=1 Tax=Chelonus insularis TaxID=460826 RepID=UPI00158CE1DB|nr:ubiquinol-cytochrome-c reductase complex assembly factor 2 [Chelonus insularis]